jgi:hypothetical protein
MIASNSDYSYQGSTKIDADGNREYHPGKIVSYYKNFKVREGQIIKQSSPDHIYNVIWKGGRSNCYRPRDLMATEAKNEAFTFLLNKDQS